MSAYIVLSLSDDIHPTVRIDFPKSISTIDGVLDELIKPALLASGYGQGTVDQIVVAEVSWDEQEART